MERTYLRIFMKSLWLRYNRLDIHILISLFHCWILSMCYDKAHQLLVQTKCLDHWSESSFFQVQRNRRLYLTTIFKRIVVERECVFMCFEQTQKWKKMKPTRVFFFFIWPTTKMARKLFKELRIAHVRVISRYRTSSRFNPPREWPIFLY